MPQYPTYEKTIDRDGHSFRFIVQLGAHNSPRIKGGDLYTMYVDGAEEGEITFGRDMIADELDKRIKWWFHFHVDLPESLRQKYKHKEVQLADLGFTKMSIDA